MFKSKKIVKQKSLVDNSIKQAVILCGGLGTRLGKITKTTPKPLIKIGKEPFLNSLIERLAKYKLDQILLLCSYKSKKFFKKYNNKKINNFTKIICIDEKKLLGTGGALVNAKNKLANYFYLLNGDTYFDGDLLQLNENFNKKKFDVIISTKKIYNTRYGVIKEKNNIIQEFDNCTKKKRSNINLGTYIVKKNILNNFKKEPLSFESDILPKLVKKKKVQCSFFPKSFFLDIGVSSDLKKAKYILPKIKYPAVFFDRDGVINKDKKYVSRIEKFNFTKNIFKIIKYFNRNNFLVFIVTNQSGIGRGYYTEKTMKKLHHWMLKQFEKNFLRIDEIFYSPYYKFSKKYSTKFYLDLRKPNIGMYKQAIKKWPIDKKKMIMIGDKIVDYKFGMKIKAKTIIVKENLDMFNQIKKFL